MDEKGFIGFSALIRFLAPINRKAAAQTLQSLATAPTRLSKQPRIGEKLEEFEARDVRRLLIGHYEMRYEMWQSQPDNKQSTQFYLKFKTSAAKR